MEITYEPSEQDFIDSFATNRKSKPFRKWLIRIVMAILLAVAVMLGYEFVLDPSWQNATELIPYFVFIILWFVCILVLPRWNARRQFLKQPAAKGPRTLTVDEHGIRSRWMGGSSNVEWKNYIHAVEGKQMFLLYFSPAYFNMIPKRALTPEETDQLRALLREKIPVR